MMLLASFSSIKESFYSFAQFLTRGYAAFSPLLEKGGIEK